MKALKNGELDIIIPVGLQPKPEDFDTMIDTILSQKERYGFHQFLLTGPSKGWRSIGHPPISHYEDLARIYLRAKNILEPKGIRLGWWDILTMKSGPSPDFSRMVKEDGTETPMASCPMDPAFRKRFADSAAAFVRIADPDFMILEDDYSVHAAAGGYGCFCEHHMKEFARRQGREYTREELVELFKSNTAEGYQLLKQWRELIKDSLVMISQELREAVDSVNPAIPIASGPPCVVITPLAFTH